MPPKKSSGTATGSKGKKISTAGSQPTISFKSRKPSIPSPTKKKSGAARTSSALRQSASTETATSAHDAAARSPSPAGSPIPTTPPLRGGVLVPESDDDEVTLRGGEEGTSPRRLDVGSKKWAGVYQDAKVAMGKLPPIHAGPETHNNVHHILRVFDMTAKYGPCVGVTRLQRWERAKKWGLSPPDEIREILTTVEGRDDVAYRENVLHGWV